MTNGNENIKIQNLWETAKAILRRKCTAIQSYFGKQEKSPIKKPELSSDKTWSTGEGMGNHFSILALRTPRTV